jgi:hypothetical protein
MLETRTKALIERSTVKAAVVGAPAQCSPCGVRTWPVFEKAQLESGTARAAQACRWSRYTYAIH